MGEPVEKIFDDPDFRSLPRPDQAEVLGQLRPGVDRAAIDKELSDRLDFKGFGPNIESGLARGASGLATLFGNEGRMFETLADKGLRAVGLKDDATDPGPMFHKGGAAEMAEQAAQEALKPSIDKGDQTTRGRLVQAIAGVPPAAVGAIPALELGGPVVGFGGLGALQAGTPDSTWTDVAKGAGGGAATGLAWELLGPFNPLIRAGGVAATAGLTGADAPDAIVQGAMAGLVGGKHPNVEARVEEMMRDAHEAPNVEPPAESPIPETVRASTAGPETAPHDEPAPAPPAEATAPAAPPQPEMMERTEPIKKPIRVEGKDVGEPIALYRGVLESEGLRGRKRSRMTESAVGDDGTVYMREQIPLPEGEKEWSPWKRTERRLNPTELPDALPSPHFRPPPESVPRDAGDTQYMKAPSVQAAAANAPTPGVNYRGARDFANVPPDAPLPKKLLKRADIMYELVKALKAPVQQGDMRGPGRTPKEALGTYRPRSENLRIRKWGDIETQAHEIVHMLADRHEAFRLDQDPALEAELKAMSYDDRSATEGLAELGRHWFTDPAYAQAKAPDAFARLDKAVDTLPPKQAKAMRRAQKQMTGFFEQGPAAGLRSMRSGPEKDPSEIPPSPGDALRMANVDRTHGMLRMERILTGKDAPITDGGVEAMRNLPRVAAMAEGLITRGHLVWIKDANGKMRARFAGKSLEKIIAPVWRNKEMRERFKDYGVARQALEMKKLGLEKQLSDQVIEAGMKLETPEFKTAFNELMEFRRKMLDFAVDGGLIAREQVNNFRRQEFAWSMQRDMQTGAVRGRTETNPLDSSQGIHRYGGESTRNLLDPIHDIVHGPGKLVQLTMENIARRQMVDTTESLRGSGRFYEKLPAASEKYALHRDNVIASLVQAGKDAGVQVPLDFDKLPDVLEFYVGGKKPGGNVMTVFRDGKPEYYQVLDKMLMESLAQFRRPMDLPPTIRKWSVRRRLFQETLTRSPLFLVKATSRDLLTSWLLTKTGKLPPNFTGFMSIVMRDQFYKDMIANAGAFADSGDSVAMLERRAQRIARRNNWDPRALIVTPADVWRFMGKMSNLVDMAPRLGESKRAQKKYGASAAHGSFLGAEVAVDFAMGGTAQGTRIATSIVPFLNTAIVSADRHYRAAARDRRYAWALATKLGIVSAMTSANYLRNRHIKDYLERPIDQRAQAWFIYTDPTAAPHMIPRVWDSGLIATWTELGLAAALGDKPLTEAATEAAQAVLENMGLGAPFGVDIALEEAYNKTRYGSPIVPEYLKDLDPSEQVRDTQPMIMRKFGEMQRGNRVQISPARLEHVVRSIAGDWAKWTFQALDWALYNKERTALYPEDIGNPFHERQGRRSVIESKYTDMLRDVEQADKTMTKAEQEQRYEDADRFDPDTHYMMKNLRKAQNQLADMKKEMSEITVDPDLTPTERRDRKEQIRLEMRQIQREELELRKELLEDGQ